jgi:sec-independent protein translocase protein TatA
MGSMSIWHWLIVLLVVVLIFGTKKLRNMGRIWAVLSKASRKASRRGRRGRCCEDRLGRQGTERADPGQTIEGEVRKETSKP